MRLSARKQTNIVIIIMKEKDIQRFPADISF